MGEVDIAPGEVTPLFDYTAGASHDWEERMKSHMTIRVTIAIAVLALFGGVSEIAAQGAGRTAATWWTNPDVQQNLELSSEQVSEIASLNVELTERSNAADFSSRA